MKLKRPLKTQEFNEEKLEEYDSLVLFKRQELLDSYLYDNPDRQNFLLPKIEKKQELSSFSSVQNLINVNCVHCHRDNGNAPFTLIGYHDIVKRREVIREVLTSKLMPPWQADYTYSDFFNAPSISDLERAQIIDWLDRGALTGATDKSNKLNETSKKRMPDLVLKSPKEHIIKSNSDTYQCFVYDPKNEKDLYISGVEFVSDNPEVIHHLMLYLDTINYIQEKVCWDCKNDGFVEKLIPIQSWSKGMRPFELNKGLGYKIPIGSKFVLQAHYGDENHKGRSINSSLKLFYTDSTVETVDYQIINKLDIEYLANEIIVETVSFFVEDSISLLGLLPHTHFLTKRIEIFAKTLEDNQIIPLLRIPEWDYLWQGQYVFDSPVVIPKGATIYCNVVVDNTKDNPTQPNNPVRTVHYNTNSNDEMLVLVLMTKPFNKLDLTRKVAKFIYE